jgi:hypothetical protein
MPSGEAAIRLRPGTQDDLAILWEFLAIAACEANVTAAKAVPFHGGKGDEPGDGAMHRPRAPDPGAAR